MNDKIKMDSRLELLEKLYENDGGLADRIRAERPDLVDELKSMQSMKAALDARAPRRPDAASLEAVLAAAADASAGREPAVGEPAGLRAGARGDRPPRARRALYLRSAGVATAVLTVLIAVTTVWQTDLLDGDLPLARKQSAAEHSERTSTLDRAESAASGEDDPNENRIQSGEDMASAAGVAGNTAAGATRSAGDFASAPEMAAADAAADEIAEESEIAATVERFGSGGRAFGRREASDRRANLGNEMQQAKRNASELQNAAMFSVADQDLRRRPSDILPLGMRPMEIRARAGQGLGTPVQNFGDDLTWDQAADVMEMYQQIEMIGEGVSRGWDPASVPLEMVPASRNKPGSGILPAGERRTP